MHVITSISIYTLIELKSVTTIEDQNELYLIQFVIVISLQQDGIHPLKHEFNFSWAAFPEGASSTYAHIISTNYQNQI